MRSDDTTPENTPGGPTFNGGSNAPLFSETTATEPAPPLTVMQHMDLAVNSAWRSGHADIIKAVGAIDPRPWVKSAADATVKKDDAKAQEDLQIIKDNVPSNTFGQKAVNLGFNIAGGMASPSNWLFGELGGVVAKPFIGPVSKFMSAPLKTAAGKVIAHTAAEVVGQSAGMAGVQTAFPGQDHSVKAFQDNFIDSGLFIGGLHAIKWALPGIRKLSDVAGVTEKVAPAMSKAKQSLTSGQLHHKLVASLTDLYNDDQNLLHPEVKEDPTATGESPDSMEATGSMVETAAQQLSKGEKVDVMPQLATILKNFQDKAFLKPKVVTQAINEIINNDELSKQNKENLNAFLAKSAAAPKFRGRPAHEVMFSESREKMLEQLPRVIASLEKPGRYAGRELLGWINKHTEVGGPRKQAYLAKTGLIEAFATLKQQAMDTHSEAVLSNMVKKDLFANYDALHKLWHSGTPDIQNDILNSVKTRDLSDVETDSTISENLPSFTADLENDHVINKAVQETGVFPRGTSTDVLDELAPEVLGFYKEYEEIGKERKGDANFVSAAISCLAEFGGSK